MNTHTWGRKMIEHDQTLYDILQGQIYVFEVHMRRSVNENLCAKQVHRT